ncbi:MAG: hypothetical protein DRJ38_03210 [Thermoprotei archaeon]|nr:MAG: hypothetical protein DRJ38_03210 [Thermoprotei archaeon]
MELSRISKKFLTNVPARVRRVLGIEEGDLLAWDVDEEKKIVVVRVVKNPYRALRGKYRDPGLVYEVVEESVDELLLGEVEDASDRS